MIKLTNFLRSFAVMALLATLGVGNVWGETIPAGTIVYVDVTNFQETDNSWYDAGKYYMSVTADYNTSRKLINDNTDGARRDDKGYYPKGDSEWQELKHLSGNIYAGKVTSESTTGHVTFWRKNQSTYDHTWEVDASGSHGWSSSQRKFVISSNKTKHDAGSTWCFGASTAAIDRFVGGQTLYLRVGTNWKSKGDEVDPRFAACFLGINGENTQTWVNCSHVSGDYYSVTVPAGEYPYVIFCRMKGNDPANNWDNEWNQTNDLAPNSTTTGFDNCVWIADDAWSNSSSWTKYAPSPAVWMTSDNDYTTHAFVDGSVGISLAANSTYTFKIADGVEGGWWGYANNDSYRLAFVGQTTALQTYSGSLTDQKEMIIKTAGAGTYTFNWNSTNHQLSITYPTVTHPTSDYVYFKNNASPAWGTVTAHLFGTATPSTSWNELPILNTIEFDEENYYYAAWGGNSSCLFASSKDNPSTKTGDLTVNDGKSKYYEYSSSTWKDFTVTITLDQQGATTNSSPTSYSNVVFNSTVLSDVTSNPAKTGYEFQGFYTGEGGSGTLIINTSKKWQTVTNYTDASEHWIKPASASVYAKWTQSVTLDKENGESNGSVTLTYNSASHAAITNPTRANYTFAGWYTGDDGTGDLVIDTNGELQANVTDYTGAGGIWTHSGSAPTLHAKWNEIPYSVTVGVAAGGGGSTNVSSVTDAKVVTGSSSITATPANAAWRFKEWQLGDGVTIKTGAGTNSITVNATKNSSITAVFEPRFGLLGSENDGSSTASGTMPGWTPANSSAFVVNGFTALGTGEGKGVDLRCAVTLLPNRDYKFQVYDRERNAIIGTPAASDQVTLAAEASLQLTSIDTYEGGLENLNHDVLISTVGYGTYTFKITNLSNDANLYPTVTVLRQSSYQSNFGTYYENASTGELTSGTTGGTISVSSSQGGETYALTTSGKWVCAGGSVTYTASPAAGYKFFGWYGSSSCTGNPFNTDLSWTDGTLAATSNAYAKFRPNLAYQKTAYAGWSRTVTEINEGEVPSKAVDGNLSSYHIHWNIGDDFATKGWWGVDLGDNYVLSDIKIYWQDIDAGGRAPRSYEIQAAISEPSDFSNDASMSDATHWRTIKTVSGVTQNTGSTANVISFTIGEYVTARYLRLVNKDADRKVLSLAEFEVYGFGTEECYLANPPTASFAEIADGEIKLNLSATNTNGDALTNFAVLYDGVYYDVTASEGVGSLVLPTHRDITVRVYAYDKCMQKSSGYVDVEVGDYVNPDDNLAALKTTWVSYTNDQDNEKQANLNDGVLDSNGWIPYKNTGANAWMVVDLGDTYQISSVQTFFATDRKSTNYKIYGRQEDPSSDDVRADNTKWVELASKSSSINSGATESDVNESSVSFTGAIRYVRFESFAEEWSDAENGFKLLEFRVFGSAYKSRDLTGPVISICEIDESAENETSTVLHLVASDAVDGDIFNYEISTDGGDSWTKYETDPSTKLVTIDDLENGHYTFTIRAYDIVGNYSSTSTVNVIIYDPSTNLALRKTVVAGYEPENTGEHSDKLTDGTNDAWTTYGGASASEEWFYVDLGAYYQLSRIELVWGEVYSTDYVLQVRQSAPANATEAADDNKWYTAAEVTDASGDATKTTNVDIAARYVRFHSLTRSGGFLRLREIRVYGTGYADADTHAPVITTATASYNDDGKAYLTLVATDEEDGTTNWFYLYNPSTETYSLLQTDGDDQIVIDDLTACENYTFEVQAMDKSAQLSLTSNIAVRVPIISTVNLARGKTTAAGTTQGGFATANAVDGNTGTMWSGNHEREDGVNQWLYVDLGDKYKIENIGILWGSNSSTWPQDYELQVSYDGTDFQPVAHYTTVSENQDNDYALTNVYGRYVRVWANKAGTTYGMEISELEVNGDCYDDSEKPIMLFAETKGAYVTSADIYVGAIHKSISSDALLYHVVYTDKTDDTYSGSTTITADKVVNGVFRLEGLQDGDEYTVNIYAVKTSDVAENRSENYRTVGFTTKEIGAYTEFYFPGSMNGWLGVNSGSWNDGMDAWRFQISAVDGIYKLSHSVSTTENWTACFVYNKDLSARTSGDHILSVTSGKDFIITMKGLEEYVSNYHTLYIAGDAVDVEEGTCDASHVLTWIDGTTAVWEGKVTPDETFELIFPDPYAGTLDYIRTGVLSYTYTGEDRYAKLTFDLDSWTCEWSGSDAGTYVYDNNSGDGQWSTAGNWLNNAVPTIDKDVIIQAEVEVNITDARAKSVVIDQSDSNNGQLVIAAGKELVVATTVKKTTDGSTLSATGENDIIFNSDGTYGLGALVMGTHDGTNKATVNFYSLSGGTKGSSASVNQFVGTPFNDESNILYNWYNSWVYGIEYTSNVIGVKRINAGDGMVPFKGYIVISADGSGHTYWQQGTLVASTDQTISGLNYQSGTGSNPNNENLLANSWMAPIKISAFEASDFVKTDATIYIFNAGSPDDADNVKTLAGQYSTYSISTADTVVIPAMQSFSVYTNASGGSSVKLDYSKIVYDPAIAGTVPVANRAPRKARADEANKLRLFVKAESGYGDMLYMWEHTDFKAGFENGWDGRKVFGEPVAPQLYALTSDGNMAVNCVPTFEGTVLGFKAGSGESVYTFTFECDDEAQALYLYDTYNNAYTRVESTGSYTFETTDNAAHNRFILTRNAPQIATGVESTGDRQELKAVKFIENGHVFIFRNGRLYGLDGALVK